MRLVPLRVQPLELVPGFSDPEKEAPRQVPATLLWPPTLSLDTFAVSPSSSPQSRSMDVHPVATGGSEAKGTRVKGLPSSLMGMLCMSEYNVCSFILKTVTEYLWSTRY